jgi:cell pole-organizing protein PopZ
MSAPSASDITNMSLEDSIRAMLRPMVKDWLDGNMPRLLESAIKDELIESSKE